MFTLELEVRLVWLGGAKFRWELDTLLGQAIWEAIRSYGREMRVFPFLFMAVSQAPNPTRSRVVRFAEKERRQNHQQGSIRVGVDRVASNPRAV